MFNWRWYLFWLKDKLTGGKVAKVYKELEKDYNKFDKEKQIVKLNNLLDYASKNSEFYKKFDGDITKFPVVNRKIINDNYDKIFVSIKYDKEHLHRMSTSGSTGTPFTVYQNVEKRNAVLSEILFYGKIVNYYFGQQQIYFRAWTNKNKKGIMQKWIRNLISFDIKKLNDEVISNALNLIDSKKKLRSILSYASTLDRLCEYALSNDYKYTNNSLKCVLSSSEVLYEKTRREIKRIFKCKCYSRYSNQENGILGQDNGKDKIFKLNETNYFFEFLKLDRDEYAIEGEPARVVITDLNNFALPMIRYDTGDVAIYGKSKEKLVIKDLLGRRQDMIFDTKGNLVSSDGIAVVLDLLEGVKQWQFVQTDEKNYKVILNSELSVNEEEVNKALKDTLGEEASIDFVYINEIPIMSSGKFKYTVNEML